MQKNNNKNKKTVIWFFCLITVAFICGFIWTHYLRNLPQDYTVCEVVGYSKVRKQRGKVVYEYTVNNEVFTRRAGLSRFKTTPKVGDRFMVEFPEKFEGRHGKILTNFPVESNVIPPPGGWDELKRRK